MTKTPLLFTVLAVCFLSPPKVFSQGNLAPAGAPAPSMKTLQQIEPRVPISSLPFTITNSGSYYLTTNLTGAPALTGITISASSVTLDLGGFLLSGAGSGDGVSVSGTRTNITIQNGSLRNWDTGVNATLASNSRFERLQVSQGISFGIYVGNGNLILFCQAEGNGWGIYGGNNCTIKGCTAIRNGASGIQVDSGCTIVECTASQNFQGIGAFESALIQSCLVSSNGANGGIIADSGANVIGCTADWNAGDGIAIDRGTVRNCTARSNKGDGIQVFISCLVQDNHCSSNGENGDGAGVHSLQGGNTIERNVVVSNDRGIDCNPSTGNFITGNRAQSNGSDYDIVAGNHYGAIVTSPGVGFTSTNPYVNFRF
jgi:parallel beta-helix repeat protein